MSEHIFLGWVISSKQDSESGIVTAKFRIEESYKSKAPEYFEIYTTPYTASCGIYFNPGYQYIVFASLTNSLKHKGSYTDICHGTIEIHIEDYPEYVNIINRLKSKKNNLKWSETN
ncbi:MAG: hypothetical protein ACI8P9_001886 [Parasphingorhabdus sp.]|jgi:hypothetical protein